MDKKTFKKSTIIFAIAISCFFLGKYLIKRAVYVNTQDVEFVKSLADDENLEKAGKVIGEGVATATEKGKTFLNAFKKSYKETKDSTKTE